MVDFHGALGSAPGPDLVAAIEALPGVQDVAAAGEHLRVTMAAAPGSDAPAAAVPRVLAEISRLGGTVLHLNLRGPSLDEVFLGLTGRGLRD